MKNFEILKWTLIAFVAFQFTACNNEPLEGNFPQESDINNAEEGQFIATIAGESFVADSISATLSLNDELVITGRKVGTGQSITLGVVNTTTGVFNLATAAGNPNAGIYDDGTPTGLPYTTTFAFGGSGSIKITQLNITNRTITGTFNFVGTRFQVDSNGVPILDSNGNPVIETIQITSGGFNQIPYELENGGNPPDEFFAKVDGVDFVPDTLELIQTSVGNEPMFRIMAKKTNNEMIRIDIPRFIGEGTFAMQNISDGTRLIGIYNDGVGGENLTSNPGTITFTEFNLATGVMTGTFAFTGTDPLGTNPTTVQITQGSFSFLFDGVANGNSFLTTNIDGELYNALSGRARDTIINGFSRIILSTQIASQSVSLSFPASVVLGATPMSPAVISGSEIVGTYIPNTATPVIFTSNPGTCTITEVNLVDGVLRGTFSFQAKDATGTDPTVYSFTNGKFKATLE